MNYDDLSPDDKAFVKHVLFMDEEGIFYQKPHPLNLIENKALNDSYNQYKAVFSCTKREVYNWFLSRYFRVGEHFATSTHELMFLRFFERINEIVYDVLYRYHDIQCQQHVGYRTCARSYSLDEIFEIMERQGLEPSDMPIIMSNLDYSEFNMLDIPDCPLGSDNLQLARYRIEDPEFIENSTINFDIFFVDVGDYYLVSNLMKVRNARVVATVDDDKYFFEHIRSYGIPGFDFSKPFRRDDASSTLNESQQIYSYSMVDGLIQLLLCTEAVVQLFNPEVTVQLPLISYLFSVAELIVDESLQLENDKEVEANVNFLSYVSNLLSVDYSSEIRSEFDNYIRSISDSRREISDLRCVAGNKEKVGDSLDERQPPDKEIKKESVTVRYARKKLQKNCKSTIPKRKPRCKTGDSKKKK
jgi:hypothetical protein